jgi:glycosyltransferase involved in cell wall biosynthesis
LTVLEAMSCGLPVIATEHGGIPEAVRHGVEGLLVPEADEIALAEAMMDLMKDPDRAKAMGQAGRIRVTQCFDQREQLEKLQLVLQAVVQD